MSYKDCWRAPFQGPVNRAAFLVFLGFAGPSVASNDVTVDMLVRRAEIPFASISPDGHNVAYLIMRGDPVSDIYNMEVRVARTDGNDAPVTLRRFSVRPDETLGTTEELLPGAGRVAWTREGLLLITAKCGAEMELILWDPASGGSRDLLLHHDRIVLDVPPSAQGEVEVVTEDAVKASRNAASSVPDNAWRMRDGYRFFGAFKNPKMGLTLRAQRWLIRAGPSVTVEPVGVPVDSWDTVPDDWDTVQTRVIGVSDRDTVRFPLSDWVSAPIPDLSAAVQTVELRVSRPDTSSTVERIVINKMGVIRPLTPVVRPSPALSILGWSVDGATLYYASAGQRESAIRSVSLDGHIHNVHRENSALEVPGASYGVRSHVLSEDRRYAVLVRSTYVLPAELIRLDLTTGITNVVDSPNEEFRSGTLPTVRWYHIDAGNGDAGGRLYLPPQDTSRIPYPLVITQYISRPGFNLSVGDEVPIQPLTSAGIAVFVMHSRELNRISTAGDFRMELVRVQKPLEGMEWIYHKLIMDGVVDPDHCGLAGLSYGAEIAMYALWKSSIFKAVTTASGSWDPSFYLLGGQGYAMFLRRRGYPAPDEEHLRTWRKLSAALNARPTLPPLLLQTADGEENETIPTWFRFRRAGAPVIWYEYPSEGHVKRSPANKWWVYRRNLDWFRFWLQNYEDSDPSKADQYVQWRTLRDSQHQQSPNRNVGARRSLNAH